MPGADLDTVAAMEAGARAQLIEQHLPLVRSLARRFAHRGEPLEDLVQIGTIGLIRAVDRFERRRGCPLEAYAAVSIVGEIKRHLRDHAAPLRVPRRMQQQGASVRHADGELAARLGRSPTVAELAAACGLPGNEVAQTLLTTRLRSTVSLDGGDPRTEKADAALACGDFSDAADDRAAVAAALRRLAPRDRRLLRLRFFADLSHAEVARALGISQVHVSRLERAALDRLRLALDGDGDAPAPPPGGRLATVVSAAGTT
jgi:RNA polymerase sigma-B factor